MLLLGNTLAASFIWGINTLFLLDAGLSNLEAFAANAFFTAGMMLFEIPTGIVADMWGRRMSYLLGTLTLAASTFLYYLLWVMKAPFWQWAVVSMLIGLGFTFFSGAVEAWLVDALAFAGYEGGLESVLGRGQMISGVRDARGLGRGRGDRAGDVARRAVPAPRRRPARHVRRRLRADARPGLHAGAAAAAAGRRPVRSSTPRSRTGSGIRPSGG